MEIASPPITAITIGFIISEPSWAVIAIDSIPKIIVSEMIKIGQKRVVLPSSPSLLNNITLKMTMIQAGHQDNYRTIDGKV